MSAPKTVPMSLRLTPELNERLEKCAERTKQKKHSLAQEAIEAVVDAIERNGYRLAIPIEFEVTHLVIGREGEKAGETVEEANEQDQLVRDANAFRAQKAKHRQSPQAALIEDALVAKKKNVA